MKNLYVSKNANGEFICSTSLNKLFKECGDNNRLNLYDYHTSTVADGDCYYGKLSIIVDNKNIFSTIQK